MRLAMRPSDFVLRDSEFRTSDTKFAMVYQNFAKKNLGVGLESSQEGNNSAD